MNHYLIAASIAVAGAPIVGGFWLLCRARKSREEAMHAKFEHDTRAYVHAHRDEAVIPAIPAADAGGADAGTCDGGSACAGTD